MWRLLPFWGYATGATSQIRWFSNNNYNLGHIAILTIRIALQPYCGTPVLIRIELLKHWRYLLHAGGPRQPGLVWWYRIGRLARQQQWHTGSNSWIHSVLSQRCIVRWRNSHRSSHRPSPTARTAAKPIPPKGSFFYTTNDANEISDMHIETKCAVTRSHKNIII